MMTPRRKITWSVLLLSGLAVGGAAAANSGLWGRAVVGGEQLAAVESTEHARPLPVGVLRLGDLRPERPADIYRGTIEASKDTELGFRRSGRVVKLLVDEGDRVVAGQVLAELDSADVLARIAANEAEHSEAVAVLSELEAGPRQETIAAARAEVQRWTALVARADADFRRESQLAASNASSGRDYDEARFGLSERQAALEQARQTLAELEAGTRSERLAAQRARVAVLAAARQGLEVELTDSRIEAPYAGVIAARSIDEGAVVDGAVSVFRLLAVDPLEAKFGVSPDDALRLEPGLAVSVTVGGNSIDGTVVRMTPQVDERTRTQLVTVAIAASAARGVAPGRTASLEIVPSTVSQAGFWVPIDALTRSARGLWSVFVVVPPAELLVDGRATEPQELEVAVLDRRDVRVLETNGSLARIDGEAISSQVAVVAEGIHRVTAGMRVAPRAWESLP